MGKLLRYRRQSHKRHTPTEAPGQIDLDGIRRAVSATRDILTFDEGRAQVRACHEQLASQQWSEPLARKAVAVSGLYTRLAAAARQLPANKERWKQLLAESICAQVELTMLEKERHSAIKAVCKRADEVFCTLYRRHIASRIH